MEAYILLPSAFINFNYIYVILVLLFILLVIHRAFCAKKSDNDLGFMCLGLLVFVAVVFNFFSYIHLERLEKGEEQIMKCSDYLKDYGSEATFDEIKDIKKDDYCLVDMAVGFKDNNQLGLVVNYLMEIISKKDGDQIIQKVNEIKTEKAENIKKRDEKIKSITN